MRRIHIQPRKRGGKTYYTALYYLPSGSGRSAGVFTSKVKAKSAAEVAWEKSRQGNWVDPASGKKILWDYAENTWLGSLLVEKKTLMDYTSTYRVHVKPAFGQRALSTILPTEVETWLNRLEENGVGRSTQRKAFLVLSMILKKARRDRLLTDVPTDGIDTRPIARQPVRIFTPAQWEKFMACVPEEYRTLLAVTIGTGLRASEVRALSPAQVNWGAQRLLVDRALVEVSKKQCGERFTPKDYPKGKRSRDVDLDKPVLRLLAQEIVRRGLSRDSQEPLFLFNGKPFGNDLTRAVFIAAREKAGIDTNLTMKHLRSSRASWLLKETGGDVVRVQRDLGHADLVTTQKYLAVVEDMETDSESAFEDFLKEEES